MTSAASGAIAATKALDSLARNDRGRLISALIGRLGSFQLAEEALQDAMIAAVSDWGRNGVPHSPHGWLLRASYRKAIDRLRQNSSEVRKIDNLTLLIGDEAAEDGEDIPDDRLRLIFTCCHPALEPKSQIALTLRTVCGLTTGEIAAAYLDAEPTMGQRLTRAKSKIAAAGIAYAVPGPEEWAARLQSVLTVIYMVFTAGYARNHDAGRSLAEEAIFLCRLLNQLRPSDAEIEGGLALLIITHARRGGRVNDLGVTVPLGEQDQSLWNRAMVDEGLALIDQAMQRRAPGPYQIKAAISACHCQPKGSDWAQIVLLYDSLLRIEPTPVVQLSRAVALAEAGWPDVALRVLDALQPQLRDYQPYHAANADLLARADKTSEALVAYDRAIKLATSAADIAYLQERAGMVAGKIGQVPPPVREGS